MLPFVFLSAFIWGICVAAFIQFTDLGRFIAARMTWFIVALGTGGDLLLMLFLMDNEGRVVWWQLVTVIFLSSIAVSARGIFELVTYFRSVMDGARDTTGE
jgi:hypothetical protein